MLVSAIDNSVSILPVTAVSTLQPYLPLPSKTNSFSIATFPLLSTVPHEDTAHIQQTLAVG
jgi:hypothetical protein